MENYEKRFYRQWSKNKNLFSFNIVVGQSDLMISCDKDLKKEALKALKEVRSDIEKHIEKNVQFAKSFEPFKCPYDACEAVKTMCKAAHCFNVGPMAAVAGVVAQYVGESLAPLSDTIIVENGGDIFAKAKKPLVFGLYAGEESPFKDKISFKVNAQDGLGVCTSSGVVGPSVSFGKAGAVVAMATDAALADAAATSIANKVLCEDSVDEIMGRKFYKNKLSGLIVCCKDKIGIWGDIEIV